MEKQILVECGKNWFEFTKSHTGQIDFAGKVSGENLDVSNYQEIAGSTYFSPSYYVYLSDELNVSPRIFVADGIDVSDSDVFDFLVHAGALLMAVDAKNSYLAGSLYLRRRNTFEKFAQVSQYIMEDLCVEILFSLCFGRMENVDPESIPLVFNNAQKKLEYNPSSETLEQAFIRFFKSGARTFTLPLVGTSFYCWDAEPVILENLCDNLDAENFSCSTEKIRRAKHDFYASLKTVVQAEPYNPYDQYAILACIEGAESKIFGNAGLEKVGHIRALAAKVIRLAKPEKVAYKSKLVSLSSNKIVVQITV